MTKVTVTVTREDGFILSRFGVTADDFASAVRTLAVGARVEDALIVATNQEDAS